MDWLAEHLIAALRATCNNESYLESKAEEYASLDRIGAMREISSLDSVARNALAARLSIAPDRLETFVSVLKKL